MANIFRRNKEILRRYKDTPGFDIREGGWIKQSCLNVFINIVLFIVILITVTN